MASNPTNLWLRHRTWFLRLSIPPSLRAHFGGKDKVVESLGTSDLNAAIVERDKRVAEYHAKFERLRNGTPPSDVELAAVAARVPVYRRTKQPGDDELLARLLERNIETQCGTEIQAAAELLGIPIERGSPLWHDLGKRILHIRLRAGEPTWLFSYGDVAGTAIASAAPPVPVPNGGEKFSEALEAHIRELERAGTRASTIASYRLMASVFQTWCKDAPIASITRTQASDFLTEISVERSNSTVNQYTALLAAVFETARRRGRFTGDNGFKDQKRRAIVESYEAFTGAELGKMFALATFEMKPKPHSVATALPWAVFIAAFTGLRREEVAQLRWQDIRKIEGVWAIDVTPAAGKLKNKGSTRVVPVHSALIHRGLLEYHSHLPKDGRLFPGLKGRASKGGKLGPALGDAFEAWRKTAGLVRNGLNFHSFRHGVSQALDRAAVAETDVARILGHDIPGMSFGTYSKGPGLKRLQAEIEKIDYGPEFSL
jgi:integrase